MEADTLTLPPNDCTPDFLYSYILLRGVFTVRVGRIIMTSVGLLMNPFICFCFSLNGGNYCQ